MEALNNFIGQINSFAWGPPMLIVLGATGLYLTYGLRALQFKRIPYAFRLLFSKNIQKEEGDIPPFNSLMTALSATVGTGNIAGVATAIALGGPGAVFYMWLIALVGMATKYAEAVCAVHYREKDANGNFVGGPMYYLKNGVGEKYPGAGKFFGVLFAVFGAVAAFGIGNAAQVHSMADVLHADFKVPTYVTGILVAAFAGFVILGGVRRISNVAAKLVPTMIVLYLGASIIIVLANISEVPAAIGLIIQHAFTPIAATGGFAGAAVAAAIRFGVARGVFSNESGLGSAAIAHGAAQTKSPVRQGYIAMLGTFIDTIIVCTLTALVIITTGAWTMEGADGGGLTGAPLTSAAFGVAFEGGHYIVAVALPVFAFTTILGWSYYGERCWQYLFTEKYVMIYKVMWVIAILWFANQKIDFIWNLADTLNGLMALPNIIGLLILSPIIFKLTKEYHANPDNDKLDGDGSPKVSDSGGGGDSPPATS